MRGAAFGPDGKLLEESQRLGGTNSDLVITVNPPILSSRERDEAAATKLEGHWLYAGSWMHGFGHFLIETLPTLWPLLEEGAKFDGITAHRFNSPRLHDWQTELVQMIFPGKIDVIIDGPKMVQELTLPVRPSQYQGHISPVAAKVWDAISAKAGSSNSSRVFLSRTQFEAEQAGSTRGREYANSAAVDDLFRDKGFTVIYPEIMSVRDQIKAVRSAPIVAGQGGSALHLSVFTRAGGKVMELGDRRTTNHLVGAQQAISFAKGQPTVQVPYVGDSDGNYDLKHLASSLKALGV